MSDAEKAAYDAVTAQLNRDRPLHTGDAEKTPLAQTLLQSPEEDDDTVDVLDPTSAAGLHDAPTLKERLFKPETDAIENPLGCTDADDCPVAVSVHAVRCGGCPVDASLYFTLQAHQKSALDIALQRLCDNNGIMLAHGTGTGKTLTTLAVAHGFSKLHPCARILVVCPKSLIFQWKNEMDKYPALGLTPHTFLSTGEQLSQTRRIWREFGGVGIIGTEMFRNHVMELEITSEDVIVVDEAQQQLKATTTILYKALETSGTQRRVLLSGSPLQNRIEELYNMVSLIEPGFIGASYSDFYNQFGRVIEAGMRRSSTNLQLRQSKVMTHVLHKLVAERAAHFVSSEQVLKTAIPGRIDWLLLCEREDAQGTEGTEMLGTFQQRNLVHTHTLSTKVRIVSMLLDDFAQHAPTDQVVVFSARKETLQTLAAARPGSILNGDITSIEERQKVIDTFRATSGAVLYVGLQVGGVGLNLNFASRVILTDISWNPMDDWQAVARVHRMGQQHRVRTYRLCVKGSVEERAYWLGVNKSFLAASIVNEQDVTRVYDMTELASVSIDPQHFVPKDQIKRDCCLKRVVWNQDWITVVSHDAVTAKQNNDKQLTKREKADAINQYNSLATITAPACYDDNGTLCTRYRAGVDHIHIRVPVPNLCTSYFGGEPCASVELMHKLTADGSWQTWHSYHTVSSDGQTMRLLLHTSKDSETDSVALTPGTHVFKIRRVSADDGKACGGFSARSAPLSVVM